MRKRLNGSSPRPGQNVDDVELFNLLICGAQFVGSDFLASETFDRSVNHLTNRPSITYFQFITLKFCMRKDMPRFAAKMADINRKARERILAAGVDVARDTEEYLIAIDYLSSDDVPLADRQSAFKKIFKIEPRFDVLREFGKHVGFADWSGLSVEHQLKRKALRPVYAWS